MTINFYAVLPILSHYLDEQYWTVGKQMLWIGGILLTVSVFSSIYASLIGLSVLSVGQFFTYIFYVLIIGIFPVAAVVVFDYWRLYKKHRKQAVKLKKEFQAIAQKPDKTFVLTSDNQKELIQLQTDNLLYLSSADNYVEVTYLAGSDVKKKLLRGTLKSFENQLNYSSIIRCHRSFIVNLSQVINVSGNAQGYNLQLRGCDCKIPVSRSYADEVIAQLER